MNFSIKDSVFPHNAKKNVAREGADLIFLLGGSSHETSGTRPQRRAIPHEIRGAYIPQPLEQEEDEENEEEEDEERKKERKKGRKTEKNY